MRFDVSTALLLTAIGMASTTPTRRDGCGSLRGAGDVSNFKLEGVTQTGDSISSFPLGLAPRTPSLLVSWIAVSLSYTFLALFLRRA